MSEVPVIPRISQIGPLLQRGRDPFVFATEILGVRLNPAQKRWIRQILPVDGWKWPRRTVVLVSGNQVGKTFGLAIVIMWACTYKIGIEFVPGDKTLDTKWLGAPYIWFHVAPVQQQAYHPLKDIRLLLSGNHPAQVNKVNLPPGWAAEVKVENYYDGLEFWNGSIVQFRTTEDKAKALQGYRANGISFDEAAFEDHLTSVINETLMMRLISTGGPLLTISTPNGMNEFFDLVDAVVKTGLRPEERVWRLNDSAVVWSTIADNVGFGVTQVEVDRMEATLDSATKEQQLRGTFLAPAEAFFVPTDRVLAAFRRRMPNEAAPLPGHRYVIFWDPSSGKEGADPSPVVVLDITKKPLIGVYFRHYPFPMGIIELVNAMVGLHGIYNGATDPMRMLPPSRAITGWDATSMGGQIVSQLVSGIRPNHPFNFGGPEKKIKSLYELRAALTKGDLLMPDGWVRMRQEVMSYRLKDDKLKNDCVMALDGALAIASGLGGIQSRPFEVHARYAPVY